MVRIAPPGRRSTSQLTPEGLEIRIPAKKQVFLMLFLSVKHLRVEPLSLFPTDMGAALRFWGIGGGPIAFDYGSKTLRFGAGLDDAEARDVIRDLRERHTFPEPPPQ
jgi:hypothetical protein